ncbi:MAG: tyrosine-type recombinase/integrase [Syntrophorhabdaceae bacterium]|nr:tyrosine-type recombinase/integrase [Syntrophorhabdaceae bacterium]
METIKIRYLRSLKRKNFSSCTVKNYMNRIDRFTLWLRIPLHNVTRREIGAYVDHLLRKRLSPKTITCHLQTIRLPKPLPRHLRDAEVETFLAVIADPRDRAMFMRMLRCGLRVEEVAHLTVDAVEYRKKQVFVLNGKGARDRVVYLSDDARCTLETYMARRSSRAQALFLVQKGPQKGKPISVRGIQKRIEYYGRKSRVNVSCHRLRHTFATQLLNADAHLATIQDLLGHEHITTTQRYCRVANIKVQRDYYKAMELVLQRMQAGQDEGNSRSYKNAGRGKRGSTAPARRVIPLRAREGTDGEERITKPIEGGADEGSKRWRVARRTKRN